MSEDASVVGPPSSVPRGSSGRHPGRDVPEAGGFDLRRLHTGLLGLLVLLVAAGIVTAGDRFTDPDNIETLLYLVSVIGILGVGTTVVVSGGGIDVSVGAVLGLATVCATATAVQTAAGDTTWLVMVGVAILVGAVSGLVTGLLAAYSSMVAIVVTLVMLIVIRGSSELAMAGSPAREVQVEPFLDALRGSVLGVPKPVWIFAVVAGAGWFLLHRTAFGRRIAAIGSSVETARLAGIRVDRHVVCLYVLTGLAAAIAAVLTLAWTGVGSPEQGTFRELDAIAAVVLGGTLIRGGRGSVRGTVLGAFVVACLTNLFFLNGVDPTVARIVLVVTVGAIVMLQYRTSRRRTNP